MAIDWWRLQSSLIEQVKKHPCLYDGTQQSHWNPRRREPYWRAVAQAVDMPDVSEVECRRLWRGLRDKYVREIQLGATRAPDGTLVRAESQWPLLKRLDFLRHHIRRRRRRSQKAATTVSTTYDWRPAASVTAVAGRAQGPGALSPVDLEIDASPAFSVRTDSTDGWDGVPTSSRATELTVSAVRNAAEEQRADFPPSSDISGRAVTSESGDAGSWRKEPLPQWQASSQDAAQTAHKRRRSEDRLPEDWISCPYSSADDSEQEGGGNGGVDYSHNRARGSERRTRSKSGDIEVALCRFLTATTRKMAASSAASCAPPTGHGGRELRVNAGDADALFLLGLKGLMCTLDAESKSRAQMDILRLLRDRIAEAARRPQSVADGNCDVTTTSEHVLLA